MQKRSQRVWRRRECGSCGAVFTTEEGALYEAAWTVQGSDGAYRPFSRDKLFLSLYKSCQHRPGALGDAGALADTVINKLALRVEDGRLWAGTISQAALVALSRFDKTAGVHYQAFHR